jgi:predicted ATPase
MVPQTLHGREEAIAALLAAFGRSAEGGSEMLLVAGYSGIGKSAVVNEVHKPIVARRGCFLAGKFDQFQRDVPYASLIQAFQGLVRQLLGEPEDAAAMGRQAAQRPGQRPWRDGRTDPPAGADRRPHRGGARAGAGTGPAPPGPRVPALRRACSPPPEHPLVLFLDDLQWADAASLRMIELFMVSRENRYMLFIGAYRDNEVDAVIRSSACATSCSPAA